MKKIILILILTAILFGVGFVYRKAIYNLVYYRYFEVKLSFTEIQHDPNDLAWDILKVTELGNRLAYQWGYEDRTSFSGKFVAVSWFITNDGKELRQVDIEQIIFRDQNDRIFEPLKYNPDDNCGGGRLAMIPKIAPGLKCYLVFLYEMPEDATDFYLTVIYRIPRAI